MSEIAASLPSLIRRIVANYPASRESLIPILQETQEEQGYLSPGTVDEIARHTGISANEIYGVATFYSYFRFSPPGEHTILACQGTACHVRGGHQVLRELEERLGIRAGETTADGRFELQRVACVGCCALAPVAVVDGTVHAGVTPKKVRAIVSVGQQGKENRQQAR
jgi:NADH-quinone oxidoreductase subunit E